MIEWTKAQREYFARFGKQGGKRRAQKLTPEERAQSARRAAQARWKKNKAKKQQP